LPTAGVAHGGATHSATGDGARGRLTPGVMGSVLCAALGVAPGLALLPAWAGTWTSWPPVNTGFVIYCYGVGSTLHLISPHAMVYDGRPTTDGRHGTEPQSRAVALPLLVGSLLVPWLSHVVLAQTWPSTLCSAVALAALVLSSAVGAKRGLGVAGT
jgi:hypothetical protein